MTLQETQHDVLDIFLRGQILGRLIKDGPEITEKFLSFVVDPYTVMVSRPIFLFHNFIFTSINPIKMSQNYGQLDIIDLDKNRQKIYTAIL